MRTISSDVSGVLMSGEVLKAVRQACESTEALNAMLNVAWQCLNRIAPVRRKRQWYL